MPRLDSIIRQWQTERNTAPDQAISSVDERYALAAGLPVLAALHRLDDDLERSDCRLIGAAEIRARIRMIISLAVGEGIKRAQRSRVSIELPGVPSMPVIPLLEDLADEV